jgi:imidazolonepropionase-like amidohydrolase
MASMRVIVVLFVSLLASCVSGPSKAPADLLLRSINVVDIETGTVLRDRDVLIRAGRIEEVRASVAARPVTAPRIVDGRGQYLIPALWDAHVHLESLKPEGAPALDPQRWHVPLSMSYGVVGMRDMGSRTTDILALRAAFAAKRAAGHAAPILFVTGQAFSGKNPWGSPDHLLPTETPDEAERLVRQQIDRGVDFIKVHDFLAPDVYRAVVSTARQGGMAVSGHLRPYAGPLEAAKLGHTGFEHLPPELLAYCGVEGQRETDEFYGGWFTGGAGYYERSMAKLHAINRAGCPALFSALSTQNVSVTPTLSSRAPVRARTFAAAGRLLPPEYLQSCNQAKASREAVASPDVEAYLATVVDVIGELKAAEVALLAGTDGTPENCAIPGMIVLDELNDLVSAGLSRAEALQTATINAAQRLGEAESGVVKPGALADLVVLSGNPLEDFASLEEPDGLVIAGSYLDRKAVLALREEATQYVQSLRR